MRTHTLCILGGTGFVGHHLTARLARDGHRIRVLTRRRERHRDLLVLPQLELLDVDVHDPAALKSAVAGSDVVINLIGILNERGHKGKGFERVHVELVRKVIDACRANRIHRLLHMSALGADAGFGASHYLRTKGEGENLAHTPHNIHVTSFRPSVIFGSGDSFFNRFAGLLRMAPGVLPLACPNARFAPVHVADVAEAFARSLDNRDTFGRRYDLCGPRVYTLKELVEETARMAGIRRKVIGLSRGLSRLQATVAGRLPGKPFSLDNFHSLQRDSICQGPFPEVFGITPTSVEAVVPGYLGPGGRRSPYDDFRSASRR